MQSPAKKRVRKPKLGLHKASGQARVLLSGVTHYCGVAGTPEAHARYAELVQQWLNEGRQPLRQLPHAEEAVTTFKVLFDRFLAHCDATGRYHKRGEATSSRSAFDWVGRSLSAHFGKMSLSKLTEAGMVTWRDVLERDRDRTRTGVNRLVAQALQVLRWGRTRGFVTKSACADACLIEPLRLGEVGERPETGRPRRAVTAAEAEKVAQQACPQIAAMVRLQALTGMRPGEVCTLRWADICKTPIEGDSLGCWVYTVQAGKTSHRGHVTRYLLGPAAQEILERFPALPTAFIFSPAAAMAERRQRLRAARKTPPTGQTLERDAKADRDYATRWGINEYRHAVERAAKAAKVERFTPHELRTGFATWACNALSLSAAAAALNHRHLTTTQGYVKVRANDALAVAAAVQARVTG